MPGIFISYRRKDAGGYAGRLHQELARRYGRDAVFMDIDSIRGGVDFKERIHEALDSSDIALVLIGEAWTAPSPAGGQPKPKRRIDDDDDLVRREVAAALRDETVTVVPVLVEDANIPEVAELPGDISSLPGLQIRRLRNSDWLTDVERICRAVDEAAGEEGAERITRRLRQVPRKAAVGTVAVLALAAITAFALSEGGEGGGSCRNQFILPEAREQLAIAANNPKQAVDGSVFYGTCGARTWAMAAFPDGTDGVFVQSDLKWVDLGPIAAAKCMQVPRELLEAWKRDDC